MNPYTIETIGNVLIVRFTNVLSGWEQVFLLSSDRHHDNKHCDRRLERRHLDQALERDALVMDWGDLFCAMQGKYDPRADMSDIRPEDVGTNYFDNIVMHAARDYGPYASHWLLMAKGNHESSILRHHHHDLTSALVHRLNTEHGGSITLGGFGGWVRFVFMDGKSSRGAKNLKYFHGAGGGGPVTRGVIQTNRQAVYLPDADIVCNGHTHDSWHVPIARERLTNRGIVKRDLVHFIRTAGYKDEYADGSGGYHVERWGPPKPIGSVWMRFRASRRENGNDLNIDVDITQAVE